MTKMSPDQKEYIEQLARATAPFATAVVKAQAEYRSDLKECWEELIGAAKERQKEINMNQQYLYMIVFWNGDRWEPSSVAFATLKKATDSLSKATEAKPTAPHEIVCITAPPPPPEAPESTEP